ncbi:MAG TPA: N(4)-(beta-N-acetylglucosaminyl)-L-asparaginase [Gemmatimonadaceae bacterium]|nr:N(4)-(beta-N-acetylglucosaminyl)-L-asparaginase [Gemmatimonadaceae bacterium]
MPVSRRDFIGAGAAAAAGLALPSLASAAAAPAPGPIGLGGGAPRRPIVISSANGFYRDNPAGSPIKKAYDMIVAGADPLDAAIAGVTMVELDPNDMSVGLGGLPNEDGVVQLDASCMHGPTKRAGAVGCLEDIATAAQVAKAVMDRTEHIFLVGAGAKKFALEMGFKEQNLITDKSREAWLKWKSRLNPNNNWLDIPDDSTPARRPRVTPAPHGNDDDHVFLDEHGVPYTFGTINMNAVTASGDIGSVTTTSGIAWKIPGRVGDSPIVGAGQYCDNGVGAAGSTGRGESNIKVCGAFLAVELMRQGKSPEEALLEVMRRVIAMTEKRLLDDKGRPYFDLSYYAVTKDGRYAGSAAYEGGTFAVADANGPRAEPAVFLFKRDERPRPR